jgi:hypothetical protein
MVHRDFGKHAMESISVFRRFAATPLIVINHEHAIAVPSQRNGMICQRVLSLTRFPVLEYLVGSRLPHIHDRQSFKMARQNLWRNCCRYVWSNCASQEVAFTMRRSRSFNASHATPPSDLWAPRSGRPVDSAFSEHPADCSPAARARANSD